MLRAARVRIHSWYSLVPHWCVIVIGIIASSITGLMMQRDIHIVTSDRTVVVCFQHLWWRRLRTRTARQIRVSAKTARWQRRKIMLGKRSDIALTVFVTMF